jgi:hypothetical protein
MLPLNLMMIVVSMVKHHLTGDLQVVPKGTYLLTGDLPVVSMVNYHLTDD